MWKSSTVADRYGSEYCERPIQFWLVFPRAAGCSVILVLAATGAPLTYSVPVVPDSVTATCDQVFSGRVLGAVICCSCPLPLVLMAKRSGPPPALSVRNM